MPTSHPTLLGRTLNWQQWHLSGSMYLRPILWACSTPMIHARVVGGGGLELVVRCALPSSSSNVTIAFNTAPPPPSTTRICVHLLKFTPSHSIRTPYRNKGFSNGVGRISSAKPSQCALKPRRSGPHCASLAPFAHKWGNLVPSCHSVRDNCAHRRAGAPVNECVFIVQNPPQACVVQMGLSFPIFHKRWNHAPQPLSSVHQRYHDFETKKTLVPRRIHAFQSSA